jgi:hypothetical protein
MCIPFLLGTRLVAGAGARDQIVEHRDCLRKFHTQPPGQFEIRPHENILYSAVCGIAATPPARGAVVFPVYQIYGIPLPYADQRLGNAIFPAQIALRDTLLQGFQDDLYSHFSRVFARRPVALRLAAICRFDSDGEKGGGAV